MALQISEISSHQCLEDLKGEGDPSPIIIVITKLLLLYGQRTHDLMAEMHR